MHEWLADVLDCPSCRAGAGLRIESSEAHDGEILTGSLVCRGCAAKYAVTNGVARFVAPADDYCANFGFQWRRWTDIQIDRLGGHHLSERRFFAEVPWDREWTRGKLLLDAGCGAGRFTDVAAAYGARVIACDLSEAIDACREVTRVHGSNVQHVQASIYDLPFKKGVFDALYCLGVIQHTPDPPRTMETLPVFLKPEGKLAYDFYERTRWESAHAPRWALRRFTPSWPTQRTLLLSQVLTAAFFPIGKVISRTPLLRILVPALPIAVTNDRELSLRQEYVWSLLDTFDYYGPAYEKRQHYTEVAALLARIGLTQIKSRPGVVTAVSPAR